MGVQPDQFNSKGTPGKPRKGNRLPSNANPANPIEGDIHWRTDLNQLRVWDGASWRVITIT